MVERNFLSAISYPTSRESNTKDADSKKLRLSEGIFDSSVTSGCYHDIRPYEKNRTSHACRRFDRSLWRHKRALKRIINPKNKFSTTICRGKASAWNKKRKKSVLPTYRAISSRWQGMIPNYIAKQGNFAWFHLIIPVILESCSIFFCSVDDQSGRSCDPKNK